LGRVYLDERDGGMGEPRGGVADEFGFLRIGEGSLEGKVSRHSSLGKGRNMNERLVAIKITPRRAPGSTKEEEERTRVRFVREVEVLKVGEIFCVATPPRVGAGSWNFLLSCLSINEILTFILAAHISPEHYTVARTPVEPTVPYSHLTLPSWR
jgi:hypothetical protein